MKWALVSDWQEDSKPTTMYHFGREFGSSPDLHARVDGSKPPKNALVVKSRASTTSTTLDEASLAAPVKEMVPSFIDQGRAGAGISTIAASQCNYDSTTSLHSPSAPNEFLSVARP